MNVTRIGAEILTLDDAILFDTSDGPALKMDCDSCESTYLWLIANPPLTTCPDCQFPLHARGRAL